MDFLYRVCWSSKRADNSKYTNQFISIYFIDLYTRLNIMIAGLYRTIRVVFGL